MEELKRQGTTFSFVCQDETCYLLSHETKISREIKILAEVEKIWIQYDMDNNGELDFDEISEYLTNRACSHLKLSHIQLKAIFDLIDQNGD